MTEHETIHPDRRNQNPPNVETGVPFVETSIPPDRGNQTMKPPKEQITERLAVGLKRLELSWIGKPIGIGFSGDLDTGRITITIGPDGQTFNLVVTAQAEDVRIGDGEWN